MAKSKYPYSNTDLKSLPGERWKKIPGLEGHCVISNYGRVKRYAYRAQHPSGTTYTMPEKIIKPHVVKYPKKNKAGEAVLLAAKILVSGKPHRFTLARLVYHCFVQSFDLADDTILIIAVDGDNLNLRPDNLRAVSRNHRDHRTIYPKINPAPPQAPAYVGKAQVGKQLVRPYEKQVSQYNVTGKRIKTFASMADAQRATGISYVSIRGVANGGHVRAGGYFWRWGKANKIDVAAFLTARQKDNRLRRNLKVTQYTLTGKKIAQFPSVQDAEEATGANASAIYQVMKGKFKSAKGYFWKEGFGPLQIDLTGHQWGGQSAATKLAKPIAQYSLTGELIRTFESVKAAAAAMKVHRTSLSAASRDARRTCKGWRWKAVQ